MSTSVGFNLYLGKVLGMLNWLKNSPDNRMACKAITRKRIQCKNYAMNGTDFCYIHSIGRFRGVPIFKNPIVHLCVSILVAVLLFRAGPSRSQQQKIASNSAELLKRTSQNIGVLTPKYQKSYKQETAGIALHGNTGNQIYTIQMKDNVVVQPFGRMIPFSLERTEKGLLISMVIQSSDGKITAKMIRNKWVINPNNRFRTNYDAHALEIIDDYDIPVLQIEYLDAVTLKIGGVFFPESENISSISIYHDFPSVPDNVREVALFSMGPAVIILGKGVMIARGKPNTPSEKEEIRTIAKRYIEPWFDYSDPEIIGIRKTDN